MTIAERLASGEYRGLHRLFDEVDQSPIIVDHPRHIVYLGISELSISIDFSDGSNLRITNPKFTQGLKIEARNETNATDVRRS